MPTPAPITPVTATEALNTGVAIIQMLGIYAFILFALFVGASVMLFRRFRGGSR